MALVRSSSVYAVLITGIPGGKTDVDSGRVMMVTSKQALRARAAVIGVPKLPEALGVGNYCQSPMTTSILCHEDVGESTHAKYRDLVNRGHNLS
jgi:hypothetical protein